VKQVYFYQREDLDVLAEEGEAREAVEPLVLEGNSMGKGAGRRKEGTRNKNMYPVESEGEGQRDVIYLVEPLEIHQSRQDTFDAVRQVYAVRPRVRKTNDISLDT